ncbi:MAG: alpha/beta hydrolase [Pseudomonadota bacterium]
MNVPASSTPLSLRALLVRLVVNHVMRPVLATPPTAANRLRLEKLTGLTWVPRGTKITEGQLGNVPVEWVANSTAGARGFVLYLHGGGYVTGSPRTHRGLTSRIARAARVCVAVPDYRLAPEHPHPAAVDDALAAYKGLLDQGIPPHKIIIAGDSAGGGLSLALALRIKAAPLPQPAGLVLLSPWTDLTLAGGSMQSPQQKEWLLTKSFIVDAANHYAGGQDARQPTASPLFADLTGLAAMLVQVGTEEVLLDDSTRLSQAATQQGVPVTLQIWPQLWHVWQLHGGQMPEADRAIAAIAEFIHGRLTGKL